MLGFGKTCQIWPDISTCLPDVNWGCPNSGHSAQLAVKLVALQETGVFPVVERPRSGSHHGQRVTQLKTPQIWINNRIPGQFEDMGHSMEDLRDDGTGGPNRK